MSTSPALEYSSQPKLSTTLLSPMATKDDLSKAYTPGIAEVCTLIQTDENAMFTHTFRRNNLAVISDGSAVLGLGNIGSKASYPVMEGKAMLFKRFGNIDAIPIIVNTQDVTGFVETVVKIADSFAAINLEDIAAPRCFEIEKQLKDRLSIPIMHDDQHGTAVVVLAGLLNALKIVPKKDKQSKIVVVGAGAAGLATVRLLVEYGFKQIVLVDSQGIVCRDRGDLSADKQMVAETTNPDNLCGSLEVALTGADVFIGVSKAGLLTSELLAKMTPQPIVFAMANPVPEMLPEEAAKAGVGLIATGRSDFANQVNNALAFPGIFRAAIDKRAKITEKMKVAAAEAIVEYHSKSLKADNLLPSILDEKVHQFIAAKVSLAV